MGMTIIGLGITAVVLASLPASSDGQWSIGATSFRPGKSSSEIREMEGPPLSEMGGIAYLLIENPGSPSRIPNSQFRIPYLHSSPICAIHS